MKVGVLLLAAGRARRFGSDKRQALLGNGQTLLAASVEAVGKSGLPLLVCLGTEDKALADTLADDGIAVTACADATLGMGHTLAHGAAQCPPDWDGLLVALADMPLVRPRSYLAIARQLTRDTIVVPYHDNRRGNPVGFGSVFFDLLASCSGDQGARQVIKEYERSVCELALDDPGLLQDVDTVEALAALDDAREPQGEQSRD